VPRGKRVGRANEPLQLCSSEVGGGVVQMSWYQEIFTHFMAQIHILYHSLGYTLWLFNIAMENHHF